MSTASYEHDSDGSKFIPATQRPDGTWRKPRRIKDGYVPQEEVPLYESKGKQFLARQTGLPVGLTPEIVAAAQKSKKQSQGVVQPIPGVITKADKTKKKKKKKTGSEDAAEKLASCSISETAETSPKVSSIEKCIQTNVVSSQTDPAKKLKNLRKKLREIETLEEKIKSGIVKTPDKDQKEKLTKKIDVIKQIEILELEISE